jgi:hypothetical protein
MWKCILDDVCVSADGHFMEVGLVGIQKHDWTFFLSQRNLVTEKVLRTDHGFLVFAPTMMGAAGWSKFFLANLGLVSIASNWFTKWQTS